MRVLIINSVCGTGSTGRICVDIADMLTEKGYQCKIAYGRKKADENFNNYAVRIGSDIGVRLHGVLSRIFDNTGFYSTCATKKFIKWIKKYDPDVINLHNLHGYYLNIKLLFEYLKESGKPVVWTLHDCWPFTGHCAYFCSANCTKWKTGADGCCPKKKEYPASLFIDNSKNNYKRKKQLITALSNLTIVTPSQWLADLTRKSFLSDFPVKVINNGINTDNFKATTGDFIKQNGLENKKILLGVASIWEQRKGLNDFFSLRELLDDNYAIVLVGLTEKQKQELPQGIIGITRTENVEQLAEIYTAADVLVNPTREENYPTVNLEAQACGTPVVTYDTGGSAECLIEGVGAVTSEKTPEALKKAIMDVLNKEIKIDTENLKQEFSQKERFKKYISLFEEIGKSNEK